MISIVVPAYNEERIIGHAIGEIMKVADEVIV
ncbi:MAG: glycosyltransferase family 2 protein, partial [Desulfocapsa sp.]